jgi:exonuclease SbcD
MRILHTADWHLNDRLGRIDRQPDLVARLNEMAGYLDAHDVDVLLVAGDFFSTFSRVDTLRDVLGEVNRVFRPFLLRGGTMLVLSGNHDHEATFSMLRTALDLASPVTGSQGGVHPGGRLYLTNRPGHLALAGRGGQVVQFVLLPYPTPARYLRDRETVPGSLEERHHLLSLALVRALQRIREQHIDPRLPSVLAGHIHVRGSEVHNLYHVSEREDVIFEPGEVPTNWAYVALGHIHKPQALPGAPHARYAGSIERMDLAERSDDKGAVLVEVGPAGLVGQPTILPLAATPIYAVAIDDPDSELPGLAERYPDRERALVRYTLTYEPGKHNPDALRQEIERIFPRWYWRDPPRVKGQELQPAPGPAGSLRDVRGTTRAYLEERLRDHKDRAALLELADRYLDEQEVSA